MFQGKLQTNHSVTAIVDGRAYTVSDTHPNYDLILKAMQENDSELFVALQKEKEGVRVYASVDSKGNDTGITVDDDNVYYHGKPLHNVIVDRILGLRQSKLPVDDMVTFLENLLQNPSSRSVQELYDFLEHKNLPITSDGCFLAYKSVGGDFYSKAAGKLTLIQGKEDSSGRIYNGVGETIECPRNEVDDERVHECSHGLHVGALAYAGPNGWYNSSSDNVVIVKVNPKDVVSVPRDHSAQKVRVCKYEVMSLFQEALHDYSTSQAPDDDDDWNEDWDEDEDEGDYNDYLQLGDLRINVELRFEYENETRHVKVQDINYDGIQYFIGILLDNDPKYSTVASPQYRNFRWAKCSEVEEL